MLSVRKTTEVELQRNYLYRMHIVFSNIQGLLTQVAPTLMNDFGKNTLLSIDILNKDFPGMSKNGDSDKLKWKGQVYQYNKSGDSSGEDDITFYCDEESKIRDLMVLFRNCSTYLDDNEFWFPMNIEKYDVDRETVSQRVYFNYCKVVTVKEDKSDKGGNSINTLTIHVTWNECLIGGGDLYGE
jgi:hypothetical protein